MRGDPKTRLRKILSLVNKVLTEINMKKRTSMSLKARDE
jgi:hypothetical protein